MNHEHKEFPALPERLSGVIFDCDGVMINSRAANAEYYNRVLGAFGLPPMTEEQESYAYMATAMQSLLYIVPEHLHNRIPEVCRTAVNYRRDILPLIRLEDGFMEFLDLLGIHGVRRAVHTNRSSGMAAVLDMFSLNGYFDPVVTSDMVEPKPAPDGVLYVLERWKVPARELLFVGDSPNDAASAAGGGVAFAAFGNPELEGSVRVNGFGELADILRDGPLR